VIWAVSRGTRVIVPGLSSLSEEDEPEELDGDADEEDEVESLSSSED
jgi:hypothetical protein